MPTIKGSESNDTLTGTKFDDRIFGFDGDDLITGRGGNDRIDGGTGADSIHAGLGDDVIRASTGADQIDGGGGVDILSYGSATFGVEILGDGILFHDFSDAPAFGQNWAVGQQFSRIETLKLSSFNDRVVLDNADMTVFGRDGDDYIIGAARAFGGRGADILNGVDVRGGKGADHLTGDMAKGGRGADVIAAVTATGGHGADQFEYHDDTVAHQIMDFDAADTDRIRFVETSGSSNFDFFDYASMLEDTQQNSGNTVISWTGGSLTLHDIAVSELHESWFIFDIA